MQKILFLMVTILTVASYSAFAAQNDPLKLQLLDYSKNVTDFLPFESMSGVVKLIYKNQAEPNIQITGLKTINMIEPDPARNVWSKVFLMQHIFEQIVNNTARINRDLQLMQMLADEIHGTRKTGINRAFKYLAELHFSVKGRGFPGVDFNIKVNRDIVREIASFIDDYHKTTFNVVNVIFNNYTAACDAHNEPVVKCLE